MSQLKQPTQIPNDCPRLIEVALPIREISAESVRDKSLSTPVHKFGNVWYYAAERINGRVTSIFFIRSSRLARVNFHSKGLAMLS